MKQNMICLLTGLISILGLSACNNDGVNPNQTTLSIPTESGWRVTWFWDKDKDETSDFNQYTFYFRNGGVFEAVSNSGTQTGTWSTTSDDGSQRLVLFISNVKPLSEINDDWIIVLSDDQKIQLKDDSDEHLEELHFERQ